MAEFNMIAGHPALDLVNSYDNRFRPGAEEELLSTYDDLLRFATQAGLLNTREKRSLRLNSNERARATALRAAHQLREALAAVLYASLDDRSPPIEDLTTLEHSFKIAAENRRLVWSDARATWIWPGEPLDAALPVWRLSESASKLLVSEAAARVRSCEALPCRWLFLDSSKNHTRRWCDMKLCGNRMKARRHRAASIPES